MSVTRLAGFAGRTVVFLRRTSKAFFERRFIIIGFTRAVWRIASSSRASCAARWRILTVFTLNWAFIRNAIRLSRQTKIVELRIASTFWRGYSPWRAYSAITWITLAFFTLKRTICKRLVKCQYILVIFIGFSFLFNSLVFYLDIGTNRPSINWYSHNHSMVSVFLDMNTLCKFHIRCTLSILDDTLNTKKYHKNLVFQTDKRNVAFSKVSSFLFF